MGRVSKFKQWETPENVILLRGWKQNGLTNKEIAENMGITERTLYNWIDKSRIIAQCLVIGKEQARFIMENALFEKGRKGNVTAMIFWLKNNWREKYSDTQRTPMEEALTQAQIKKVEAETNIAELRAKVLGGSDAGVENSLANVLDIIYGAGKEKVEEDKTIETSDDDGGEDSDTEENIGDADEQEAKPE